MPETLAYLLTWTTYGSWLPGDDRGWVDRRHNCPGTDFNPPDLRVRLAAETRMKGRAIALDETQRSAVEQALEEVSRHRGWRILAANCRSNHVHVVVTAGDVSPDGVMSQFKAYATRALRERGMRDSTRVWTRGGSTRQLKSEESVALAVRYVLHQ